jgi:hypothetical protein
VRGEEWPNDLRPFTEWGPSSVLALISANLASLRKVLGATALDNINNRTGRCTLLYMRYRNGPRRADNYEKSQQPSCEMLPH